MTATQVRAGLGLLQFQLPLLAATELKATVNVTHENATPEQLRERMIEVGLDPDKVTTSLLQ